MNPELATELLKGLIFQSIALATPILVVAMSTGLTVSLFQAVTSIHEQTLAFVPKALAVLSVIVVTLPWSLRTVLEYTAGVFQKIPQMTQ